MSITPYTEAKPRVDIVSYNECLVPAKETYLKYRKVQKYFETSFFVDLYKYVDNFQGDSPDLHKIVFIDYCESPKMAKLPQKKLICFKWEAVKVNPKFYLPYSRVYTFDDDLVDNKKFFKFCYPVLQKMLSKIPDFKDKKFCTMVAGNWDPPERREILDFFATKPEGTFEFYGRAPEKYKNHPMSKGYIPGFSSSRAKLHVLKHYRFGICFENTHTTKGYITEKIFDLFAAGCVPIFWGPDNVTDYIPKECFIDYREFPDDEALYSFLISMDEAEYQTYLTNIAVFLQSKQAYLFSSKAFEKILLDALNH